MIKRCLVCRKEIQVKKSLAKRKKFCSKECKYAGAKLKLIPSKRKTGKQIKCPICKNLFYIKKCHIDKKKYCSKKCYTKSMKGAIPWNKGIETGVEPWNKGKKNPYSQETLKKMSRFTGNKHWRYKGIMKHQGYILLHRPNHPFCDRNGYVKRSRLVMEKHLGRYLLPTEVIHHINHIRNDDRFKNLMLFPSSSKHTKFHHSTNQTN